MPTIHLNPMPCPRPRIAVRGRFPVAYYPKSYAEWKTAAAEAIRVVSRKPTLDGAISLALTFHVTRPRTTKLLCPKPDIDNYIKAFMDAGTAAGLWKDDSQVVYISALKRWADVGRIDFDLTNKEPRA